VRRVEVSSTRLSATVSPPVPPELRRERLEGGEVTAHGAAGGLHPSCELPSAPQSGTEPEVVLADHDRRRHRPEGSRDAGVREHEVARVEADPCKLVGGALYDRFDPVGELPRPTERVVSSHRGSLERSSPDEASARRSAAIARRQLRAHGSRL
jgi:hypothetical protein